MSSKPSLIFIGVLWLGLRTCEASSLLLAHEHVSASSVAPFSAPDGLKFLIEFRPSGGLEYFGNDIYWNDDDSGSVDFTAANTPLFAPFVSWITNGLDDEIVFMTFNQFGGGTGGGGLESEIGMGLPDLVGNQIDRIRLVVNELSIEPYSLPPIGDGLQWEANLTWEFWGSPIPEPSTFLLVLPAFTALVFCRRSALLK